MSSERAAAPAGQFRLLRFRKVQKGFVAGFASVELSNGLQLLDMLIIAKDGKCWVNLPAKAKLDYAGTTVRDAGGRVQYESVNRWNSRELGDRFSAAVIRLIDQAHPGALPAHED